MTFPMPYVVPALGEWVVFGSNSNYGLLQGDHGDTSRRDWFGEEIYFLRFSRGGGNTAGFRFMSSDVSRRLDIRIGDVLLGADYLTRTISGQYQWMDGVPGFSQYEILQYVLGNVGVKLPFNIKEVA